MPQSPSVRGILLLSLLTLKNANCILLTIGWRGVLVGFLIEEKDCYLYRGYSKLQGMITFKPKILKKESIKSDHVVFFISCQLFFAYVFIQISSHLNILRTQLWSREMSWCLFHTWTKRLHAVAVLNYQYYSNWRQLCWFKLSYGYTPKQVA